MVHYTTDIAVSVLAIIDPRSAAGDDMQNLLKRAARGGPAAPCAREAPGPAGCCLVLSGGPGKGSQRRRWVGADTESFGGEKSVSSRQKAQFGHATAGSARPHALLAGSGRAGRAWAGDGREQQGVGGNMGGQSQGLCRVGEGRSNERIREP